MSESLPIQPVPEMKESRGVEYASLQQSKVYRGMRDTDDWSDDSCVDIIMVASYDNYVSSAVILSRVGEGGMGVALTLQLYTQ